MDQQSFENLLQRYIDEQCTEDEKVRVQKWFEQIEKNRSSDLNDEEKTIIRHALLKKIENRISNAEFQRASHLKENIFRLQSRYFYMGTAAALVLVTFFLEQGSRP